MCVYVCGRTRARVSLCICARYVSLGASSVLFSSQLHSDVALLRISEVAHSFKGSRFQRSL